MQAIAFCSRCRGMRVGWNARYVLHCLSCEQWLSKSTKLLIFTVLLSVLAVVFPPRSVYVFAGSWVKKFQEAVFALPLLAAIDPAVTSTKKFLKRYNVDEGLCD